MIHRALGANSTGMKPGTESNNGSAPAKKMRAALTLCLGMVVLPAAASAGAPAPDSAASSAKHASATARLFAGWVIASSDSHGLPFIIVDKMNAEVLVFYPDGRLRGAAPALLGLAIGDDSVPGIGQRKLSSITLKERTTPAGRFVASLGNNLGKKNILWVDYDSALSLHRVITTKSREHRLATASILDNRISFGCINVPAQFFDGVVEPAFKDGPGIVYILPEVKEMRAVFPGYFDVDNPGKAQTALN